MPARNARRVNSPGRAGRAPAASRSATSRSTSGGEPSGVQLGEVLAGVRARGRRRSRGRPAAARGRRRGGAGPGTRVRAGNERTPPPGPLPEAERGREEGREVRAAPRPPSPFRGGAGGGVVGREHRRYHVPRPRAADPHDGTLPAAGGRRQGHDGLVRVRGRRFLEGHGEGLFPRTLRVVSAPRSARKASASRLNVGTVPPIIDPAAGSSRTPSCAVAPGSPSGAARMPNVPPSPSPVDVRPLGVTHPGRVFANLSPAALVEEAVRRNEGVLSDAGAFSAVTGEPTGRSPKDKFFAREAGVEDEIAWGGVNQPMEPAAFARLRDLARAYLQNRDLFVFDGHACADPRHRLPLRVVTEKAWHSLFARCLFLRPAAGRAGRRSSPSGRSCTPPDFHADPARDGTRSRRRPWPSASTQRLVVVLRHALRRGDQEGRLHRPQLPAAAARRLPDALLGERRAGRRRGPVLRPLRHRQDDALGRPRPPAHRRRRARLVATPACSTSRAAATPRRSSSRPKGEPQIWDALRFGSVLENVPVDPRHPACRTSTASGTPRTPGRRTRSTSSRTASRAASAGTRGTSSS